MLIRRFYDDKLAQASYLVGCAATGEALVVDPNRDIEQYVEAAGQEGMRITHITETHIHADFVSGARELARRTGGTLHLSAEGGDGWQYGFAADDGAILLRDGDVFMVGNVRFAVMHTPGHTPEHIAFVVTDTAGADRPMGVFTGDFIFVGDVGRPDLLERAARYSGTMEDSARRLFHSLRRFADALPDFVQLWPGHGAGSACGKALGAVPQTTLGYEKLFNWGLAETDEDAFVRCVLAGQPEPPMYFAEMKRINRDGPRILDGFRRPPRLPASRLDALLDADAVIVDTRLAEEYACAHIPGTLNVPLGRSFTTWAGSVLPYDRPFHLIVDDPDGPAVDVIVRDLAMIGLDDIAGAFGPEVVRAWSDAGRAAQAVPEVAPDSLVDLMDRGAVALIDVRNSSEWDAGRIAGSLNFPLGRLTEQLDEVPRDRPLVVMCESGGRAGVAIGVLQAAGFEDVRHLTGDMSGWRRGGRPTERTTELLPA